MRRPAALVAVALLGALLTWAAPAAAAPTAVAVAGGWVAFDDGSVTAEGVPHHGSMAGTRLNRPVVGMAATPGGGGYWLVASDGGVFTFGDARYLGGLGAVRLNQPIVAVAATPSGRGYWLFASDGGVFTFGDATFLGSLGAVRLVQPIVGAAPTPSGRGYWLVAADGGVFTFGDAPYLGRPAHGASSMAATASGGGYWVQAPDGSVTAFGDAAPGGRGGGRAITRTLAGYATVDASGRRTYSDADAGCTIFPADNPWNQDVSGLPVHPRSAAWVASVGLDRHVHPDVGSVYGIPFVEVGAEQPRVPVRFRYADESDPGPYPIPPDAPVEGGSDRHVLVVDRVSCRLWELFDASTPDGGRSWDAGSGATWDLRSNALRPAGWTSADAAGLPIFPGLVRYDEVAAGEIRHALRFTARRTQRAWIEPARHFASSITDPDVPPMGARFRLRAGYDCGPYSREAQVVCAALKRYGMLLADNGSDWYVTGAPDPRWNDEALGDLKRIPGSAFEVVDSGPVVTP